VLLLEVVERLAYEFVIEEKTAQFQVEFNVRKLRKNIVVQELAVHPVAVDVLKCQVNEVALLFVDDVVVANKLLALLDSPYFVEVLQDSLRVRIDSNSYFAFIYEIHFGHFLVLFVHDTVDWV